MPQQDKIDFSDFEKQEKLSKLQQWIKTQPQLPQNIGKLSENFDVKKIILMNLFLYRETFVIAISKDI